MKQGVFCCGLREQKEGRVLQETQRAVCPSTQHGGLYPAQAEVSHLPRVFPQETIVNKETWPRPGLSQHRFQRVP